MFNEKKYNYLVYNDTTNNNDLMNELLFYDLQHKTYFINYNEISCII